MRPSPHPLPGGGVEVWKLPPAAFGSQWLYRVGYSGPEGEGSFRLTLRLSGPERYQVMAVDPLGRALWSLDVRGDKGLWLDHRDHAFCEFEGSFDVSGVPLAPFPLLSLPALLLGRLPAEPAAPPQRKGRDLSFHDARDRRWSASLDAGGEVQSWTLWDGAAPAVFWVRREGWAILSDRGQGVQVRWKEVVRETLAKDPEPLAVPSGFHEEDCREPAEQE
ncbi:MAG TPA: hypothetical protein VOA87_21350 [Thermoanaerobaculia bacterium]|nr:hypothetical protein [Thermoanaerobaculia bacterium]